MRCRGKGSAPCRIFVRPCATATSITVVVVSVTRQYDRMNARMIQTCFYRRVPCRCETDLPCRWKFCICGNVQKQKKKRKVAIRPVRFTITTPIITTPIAITIALLQPTVSSGNSDGSKHRHLPNDHYWDEEESAIEPCHIDNHGLFDPTLMRLFPSKNIAEDRRSCNDLPII